MCGPVDFMIRLTFSVFVRVLTNFVLIVPVVTPWTGSRGVGATCLLLSLASCMKNLLLPGVDLAVVGDTLKSTSQCPNMTPSDAE